MIKKIGWFLIINIFLGLIIHFIPYAFLTIDIKSQNANRLQFYYYNGDDAVKYDELHKFEKKFECSLDFKKIVVIVPKTSFDKLRIDFLGNKGSYQIKNMVVYHELFQYYYFNPQQIIASYSNIMNIKQPVIENNAVEVEILKNDAYFYGDTWSYETKVNKALIGIELLLLLVIVFYRKIFKKISLLQINKRISNVAQLHTCFVIELQNFVQYYKKNYLVIVVMTFYIVLAYGFKIFNYSFSIDSEFAIFMTGMDGWVRDGRFGVAIIKSIMGTAPLVPYIANFLAVVGIGFLALLWNYLLMAANRKQVGDRNLSIIFTLLFVSYPSTAEYMNFATYNVEVTLGQIFCAVAVYLISEWIFYNKHPLYLFYGMVFMIFSFSIYQAMFTLYIVGCCIYLLLHMYANDFMVEGNPKRIILGKYISTFFSGALLYFVLNKIINLTIQQYNYLDGFIGWGKADVHTILDRIVLYAYDMMSGNSVYRGELYGVGIFIWLLIIATFWYKNKQKSLFCSMLLTVIVFSPFILPILLGGTVPIRSQLVLPLIVAVSIYLLYIIYNSKYGVKTLLLILCICISFYQACGISRLFYGEYVKSQMDIAMAHKIAQEIEFVKKDNNNVKTVFFMGKYKYNFHQNVVRQQEMLGRSFFEYGYSGRISLFMQSLGYGKIVPIITVDEVVNFPKERYEQVKVDARRMPAWPKEGSVLEQEDLIIVKFSDDF